MADDDVKITETPATEGSVTLASNGIGIALPDGVRTQSGGGAIVSDDETADV